MENTKATKVKGKTGKKKLNKTPKDHQGLGSIIKMKETRLSLIIVAILTVIGLGGLAYVKANSDDKAVEPITTVLEIPSITTVTGD